MKKFLLSFLGTLAGIWFSVFIAFVGLLLIAAVAGVAALTGGGKPVDVERHSYLSITLAGEISDRPGSLDPIGLLRGEDNRSQGVNEIVGSIRLAAGDSDIDGIVLDCRGSVAGLACRRSIRQALKEFKEAAPDKWIYSYGDIYTQGDYYLASLSDSIYINPIGQVLVQGLSTTGMYYKTLLDRLGVDMQVVKVGTYKSAVEPYTLTSMSEPAREQQQLFLDNMWQCIASEIAEARDIELPRVLAWPDSATYAAPTEQYLSMGIADRLVYRHEFEEMLARLTDRKRVSGLTPVTPADYCTVQDIDTYGHGGDNADIAVLYATGEITDEVGDGIVASRFIPQILDLADDDDIDGLVMYVNSPGGSAFASEQIWEALEQWKSITGKPFYVAMSDYAASGGYYISCGADRIFAQPTTLTGSIGIYGLIPDISTLLNDKIGVNTSTVGSSSPDGRMPDIFKPMTPGQRAAMQGYVNRGYELFTSRCAQGRKMSQDSIKLIAEGRVWDGAEALKLGLVDELGSLDDAVAAMARQLGATSWSVTAYPRLKEKWYDLLLEASVDAVETRMLRDRLGPIAPYVEASASLRGLSPLQARMEFLSIDN